MVQSARAAPATAAATSPPREWWERLGDRVSRWTAAHPALVGRVRLAWLVVCLVGLVLLGVMSVAFPNVRAAAGVYVGVVWILLCWFWLSRTRTLTLGGLTLLYAICVPWSVTVGLISLRLSALMPDDWPLRGAGTLGPGIGIAALTEEAFKLIPVAALVLLAPGRARRFACVDWLLVGLASGAGFLTSEEVQRRLGVLRPGSRGLLDFCSGGSISDRIDCYGLASFGLNPFGTKQAITGLFGTETDGAQFAGHHVLTALVTVGVGLGIVLWRSAASSGNRRRLAAVALPLALLWVAVADHVVMNASAQLGGLTGTGTRWLEAGSTIPVPFRLWWYVGAHGHGRTGLLLTLLVAAMLCDATRARRRSYWSILTASAGPVWADRTSSRWQTRLGATAATGAARHLRDGVVAIGVAALSLAYVVTRDLRLTVSMHARQPGESRREAMLRGRASLMMQREAREIAADVDAGPGGRQRWRVAGILAIVLLLLLGLVAGPALARSIGWDSTFSGGWLAGLAENLGKWWHTLSPAQQLALTLLAGLALAIPFGFGWGLFLAGGLSYLAGHGQGVGALLRDPRRATRDYATNRSLGGMALDAGEFALTFIPAGIGSAGGVAARRAFQSEADRYLADPALWRAEFRRRLRDDRGSATLDFATGLWIVNGRRPLNYASAGKLFDLAKSHPALAKKYPAGVRFTEQGFPDFSPYAKEKVSLDAFSKRRSRDFDLANKRLGFPGTPDGYVWHHVEDEHTLLLIPEDLHDAIRHTGGHAVSKPYT